MGCMKGVHALACNSRRPGKLKLKHRTTPHKRIARFRFYIFLILLVLIPI